MPLYTALGLLVVIPCLLALIQEGKERSVATMAGIQLVLGGIYAVWPEVDLVQDLLGDDDDTIFRIGAIALAVLGVMLVVKLQNRVVGSCLACGACLIGLIAVGIIDL